MPEFADPVRQVKANPFSSVNRPTTGAIVPYRPNSSAMAPIARPPAAIPRPPVVPRAAQTLEQIRSNTVRAPLPKNWAIAENRVSGLTPKANVPLANKINARLARGAAIPAAAAPAARGAVGWFARARGVFTRVAPVVNRAVGVYGWITLAADAMEAARPQVWAALGIKDPTAPPATPDSMGQAGIIYRVDWNATVTEPGLPDFTGGVSYELEGPITGLKSRPVGYGTSWYIGYGQNQEAGAGSTNPGASLTTNFLNITPLRTTAGDPVSTSSGPSIDIPSIPAIDSKNPQRSPSGKTSSKPSALPTSQGQRSPKPSTQTRPQNPTVTKPKPFPQPNPDGPTDIQKPPPEVKEGECDPCEALKWIVEEMKRQNQAPKTPRTWRLQVPYATCSESSTGKKTSKIQYFNFEVLQIPNGWLDVFTASAELGLKGCECDGTAVASIPDWWQVRLGAERPQLVVVFKIAGTTAYHQIAIPHPAISEPPGASPLPPYRKGPYQGQLVLADNSKFTINAASESEAQRMVDAAIRAIASGRIGSEPRVHIGLRKGVAVKEADMVPIRLDYYPTGQRDMNPAWRKRIESASPNR